MAGVGGALCSGRWFTAGQTLTHGRRAAVTSPGRSLRSLGEVGNAGVGGSISPRPASADVREMSTGRPTSRVRSGG